MSRLHVHRFEKHKISIEMCPDLALHCGHWPHIFSHNLHCMRTPCDGWDGMRIGKRIDLTGKRRRRRREIRANGKIKIKSNKIPSHRPSNAFVPPNRVSEEFFSFFSVETKAFSYIESLCANAYTHRTRSVLLFAFHRNGSSVSWFVCAIFIPSGRAVNSLKYVIQYNNKIQIHTHLCTHTHLRERKEYFAPTNDVLLVCLLCLLLLLL